MLAYHVYPSLLSPHRFYRTPYLILRNDARMPHCLRWGGMASLLGGLGDRFPQHDRDLPSKAPPLAAGIFTEYRIGTDPEHPCGITNPAGVEAHVNDGLLHLG